MIQAKESYQWINLGEEIQKSRANGINQRYWFVGLLWATFIRQVKRWTEVQVMM